MRILVLCTGNRCRSQMAEGVIKSLRPDFQVFSAGVKPASEVHPLAVKVMSEISVDISKNYPKHVSQFADLQWDFVITVCSGARDNCPVFSGKVGRRIHIGFDDPDAFVGADAEVLAEFRRVRDEIVSQMKNFINEYCN